MIKKWLIILMLFSLPVLAEEDFFEKLTSAAFELTKKKVTYDPSYFEIKYPGGDRSEEHTSELQSP